MCRRCSTAYPSRSAAKRAVRRGLLEEASSPLWEESLLKEYDMFDDYTMSLIQFGYVTFFSLAFPLAPLLALINNLLQTRVDAYKLCRTRRRPVAQKAGGIGVWDNVLELMTVIAVMTNCALVGVTSTQLWRLMPGLSMQGRFLFIVVVEHVLLFLKYWLEASVPRVPDKVRRALLREKVTAQKRRRTRSGSGGSTAGAGAAGSDRGVAAASAGGASAGGGNGAASGSEKPNRVGAGGADAKAAAAGRFAAGGGRGFAAPSPAASDSRGAATILGGDGGGGGGSDPAVTAGGTGLRHRILGQKAGRVGPPIRQTIIDDDDDDDSDDGAADAGGNVAEGTGHRPGGGSAGGGKGRGIAGGSDNGESSSDTDDCDDSVALRRMSRGVRKSR
ncbi:unnamed protein product [Phaeothamnion confervicola]